MFPANMPQALISVIVPCYNGAQFLDNCVAALWHESVTREIVLVDDGSTDDSLTRAANLMRMSDGRLIILSQKNQGQASARNLGIRAASGKYLCFLDVDDTFAPGSLGAAIDILERDSSIVAVQGGIELVDLHRPVQKWQLESMESTMLGNVVVRAEVARELGGLPTDAAFRGKAAGEDGCFRVQLPRFGKVAKMDRPLLRYQVHRGSHVDFFLDRVSLKADGTLAFSEESPEEKDGSILKAFNAYSDKVTNHLIDKVTTSIQRELGAGLEFHRLQQELASATPEDVDFFEAFALYIFCRRWPIAGTVVTLGSAGARSTQWLAAGCKSAGGNRLAAIDCFPDHAPPASLPSFVRVVQDVTGHSIQNWGEPIRVLCVANPPRAPHPCYEIHRWLSHVPLHGLLLINRSLHASMATKLAGWNEMLTIQRLVVLMKLST
jgi:hypothetical protein